MAGRISRTFLPTNTGFAHSSQPAVMFRLPIE
jgi:hypothetical protein